MPHGRHWIAVAVAACGLAVASARADEFADFRLPDYRVVTWDVTLGAYETSRHDPLDRTSDGRFDLALPGTWAHETDRASSALAWSASLIGSHASGRNSYRDLRESAERGMDEAVHFAADHDRYFTRVPLFWGSGASVTETFEQSWDHYRDRYPATGPLETDTQYDYESRQDVTFATGDLALGIGRVRDVTPLADARAIEDRLLACGVLARRLSAEARQRLARVVSMEGAFGRASERPLVAEFDAIDRVLRDDGALRDPGQHVGPAARILEPWVGANAMHLPHSPVARARGMALSVHADAMERWTRGHGRAHQYSRQVVDDTTDVVYDYSSHGSGHGHSEDLVAGGRAEVQWPIGWSGQFGIASDVMSPLGHRRRLSVRNGARLSSVVTDRLVAELAVQYSRDYYRSRPGHWWSRWDSNASARVSYFVVDHVALGLEMTSSQAHSGSHRRTDSISLDLTYRLARRLTSPRLLPAIGDVP